MNEYQTGAVRDTGGKGRMDLLPMCALIRISRHMENTVVPDPETGVPHYPERDWEKGLPMHTMIDSAFRHLAKYVDGQVDEDHLCAATTNLLMAMWMEEKHPEMQDIPSRIKDQIHIKLEHNLCKCYRINHDGKTVCWGTKNRDECDCGGFELRCTHYPEKRNGK